MIALRNARGEVLYRFEGDEDELPAAVESALEARVDLSGVVLDGLDLAEASFERGRLAGASFRGANLAGASFERATLEGACFAEATLTGADLTGASLKRVVFDEKTKWPDGFDTSRIKPTRQRNLPPISPRTYDEFAVPKLAAKKGQPSEST